MLFLERIDDWLSAHEVADSPDSSDVRPGVRLGTGIYHIEDRRLQRKKS
jgi:hypothetical protein